MRMITLHNNKITLCEYNVTGQGPPKQNLISDQLMELKDTLTKNLKHF